MKKVEQVSSNDYDNDRYYVYVWIFFSVFKFVLCQVFGCSSLTNKNRIDFELLWMGEKLETVICKVMGDNIYIRFSFIWKKLFSRISVQKCWYK